MTILHIITGLGNGGAEAVLARLIQADRANVHVVVSLTSPGTYGVPLTTAGIRVESLHLRRGRFTLAAFLRMTGLIRDVNPDVVQTWMYHADLTGGLAALVAGKRAVVWGVHSSNIDADKTPRATRWVARLCSALSARVPSAVVCCSAVAANVHAEMGYQQDKLVVISNGLDLSEFRMNASARASLRDALGTNGDQVVFGMVGRWHPLKDHLGFVRALATLRDVMPTGWQAWLVGPDVDDTNAVLTGAIREAGLQAHIRCLGPRADIPAVMNAIDLHVLPSVGESFGNVTVEAMACGTPAVVTDVGAGAFIVGETGWVVPAAAPDKLAAVMVAAVGAMANGRTWRARQQAARARAEAEFGVERMVERYRRVWTDVIARGHA